MIHSTPCRNPCRLYIHLAFTCSIGPSSVVWGELGPALPFPPMRVLELWWSWALSLMCEVALSVTPMYLTYFPVGNYKPRPPVETIEYLVTGHCATSHGPIPTLTFSFSFLWVEVHNFFFCFVLYCFVPGTNDHRLHKGVKARNNIALAKYSNGPSPPDFS